ncbi:MAG TPA: glycosyltransferase family 4 protein [Candidatus Acidoferrum sp.]|nr:glycosyltransferase family 4 protein [Candidatus Acidoferrum sp.]
MKVYDFCFVMSGFPVKIPSGGENIVFNLAGMLAKDSYSVCLAVQPQADLELYSKTKDKNFFRPLGKISLVRKLSPGDSPSPRLISFAYDLLISYYKMVKMVNFKSNKDYDYSVLKNVDIFFTKNLDHLNFKTKNIVATAWQPIFLIKNTKMKYEKAYYLMQIEEDDKKFSGPLSKYAKKMVTDKSLKKIVINKRLYRRFKSERPGFCKIGVSPIFKLPKEKKVPMSVLVPLRNAEEKGAKYALEALEIIRRKHKEAKFFAYGNYSGGLPEYVNFSRLPDAEGLVKLYQKSTIFILPSLIEGFAAPPLEAMACGCAVVVTKINGTEEIKNNINGLVVPIRSSKGLANAVIRLLEDKGLMERLQKSGNDTAKEHTYQKMYESFKEALR